MPGFLLHKGATVTCSHPPGQARPLVANPRVKVGGQPIVVQPTTYSVTACGLSGTGTPPCATAQWVTAATRVRAAGVPVLLQDSRAICAPTGTPLNVLVTQVRAKGT